MRLALSTDSFFPLEGGAERQLRHVLGLLASDHDWDVTVVARRIDGTSPNELVEGLKIVRVGTSRPTKAGASHAAMLSAGALRAARPDALIAIQAGFSALAAVVASLTSAHRPATALRLTGGSVDGSELARRAMSPARRAATLRLLKTVDVIVSPAHHLLHEPGPFASVLLDKGVCIPNGVERTDTQFNQPIHVVWVGRDDPVKGLGDFVDAARRNQALSHVAVGPERTDRLAPANLVYTGWEGDPTARLRTAAAFVSTSRFEGSPNSAREALAAGVPVIAYDIPAYRELAAEVERGVWLVPAQDVAALAKRIRIVVAQRSAMDARASVRATLPSLEQVAGQWDELLRQLATERRGHRSASSVRPL